MNAAKNEVFIGLQHENCNLLGDEPLVGGFCDFGLHTLTLHYVKKNFLKKLLNQKHGYKCHAK